ncbi:MAG TPA: DUF6504 family protein [Candidatus Nanopelagicales bacterium]|jgi:hypothetical protein
MTRRYGDAIEVRSHPGARGEPVQFRSRGRSYLVRTVLARWVEVGPWWSGMGAPASAASAGRTTGEASSGAVDREPAAAAVRTVSPLSVVERTVWRVEAAGRTGGAGRSGATSVHDLVQESAAGGRTHWWLARTLD